MKLIFQEPDLICYQEKPQLDQENNGSHITKVVDSEGGMEIVIIF